MARRNTNGFEMQTVTSGVEWDDTFQGGTGGSVAIDTSVKRSGAASLKVTSAPDNSNYIEHDYNSATNTPSRIRFYIYVQARPTDATGAVCQLNNAAGTTICSLGMNTSGQLILFDGNIAGTQRGSPSTALTLNTWYRVELSETNGAGTELEAKIDGTVFASGAMTTATDATQYDLGMADFVTSFVANFDDVAVNNTAAGGTETDYPGEGRLALAVTTGAGDNNPTTGDWSMINEIPPSDTATSGSTMIELDTTTSIGDFAMTDSSTLGIDSYDTIKLVEVLGRVREEAAGTSNYTLRIKSASGGTVSSSSSVDAGNATARTNPNVTDNFGIHHVSYTDPTTGSAWTPTGTNSIDNMQVGAATTDGTPDIWVLWLGAYVEWVDQAAPGGTAIKDLISNNSLLAFPR